MFSTSNRDLTQFLLIGLILSVGIILRVGDPFELAFINDELSTWDKISQLSLSAVIDNIHFDDSHPVGLYVFMYFWNMLAGDSIWAFKFPFLILSVVSLLLIYRTSTRFFNKNTGLFAMACFASLQFPIWWSTIARQYQLGLFFVLLSIYFVQEIDVSKRIRYPSLIGLVVGFTGCMYTHYFSFLMAFFMGLFALAFMAGPKKKFIMIAGLLSGLLYIPHIPITLYQLSHADGHLWYPVPKATFVVDYISYVFHYSYICLGGFIISIGITYQKTTRPNRKNLLFCIFLVLSPLLFGLLYSIYKSPILRETHLLFSLPFVFSIAFAWTKDQLKSSQKIFVVFLILSINISTLIINRQHFSVINSHPYHHFVDQTSQFLIENDSATTAIFFNENPKYIAYYMDRSNHPFQYTNTFRNIPPLTTFIRRIKESSITSLILGSMPETYIQAAMDEFPNLIKEVNGVNFDYLILSREQGDKITYPFESKLTDHTSPPFYLDSSTLYSPSIQYPLSDIIGSVYDLIDIRAEISAPVEDLDAVLVLEINQKDTQVAWTGKEFKWQLTPYNTKYIYHSIRCSHFIDKKSDLSDLSIKCYVWNKGNQTIELKNIRMRSRRKNPILYKDTEPF